MIKKKTSPDVRYEQHGLYKRVIKTVSNVTHTREAFVQGFDEVAEGPDLAAWLKTIRSEIGQRNKCRLDFVVKLLEKPEPNQADLQSVAYCMALICEDYEHAQANAAFEQDVKLARRVRHHDGPKWGTDSEFKADACRFIDELIAGGEPAPYARAHEHFEGAEIELPSPDAYRKMYHRNKQ